MYNEKAKTTKGISFRRRQIIFRVVLILHYTSYIIHGSFAQKDTLTHPNYKALHWIMAGESVAYVGSVVGLSKAWYKNSSSTFQFADDFNEWKQIDKLGHFYSAYQICRNSAKLYESTGVTNRQAALYGALSGFMFLTPIEILDGFQYPEYGFSPTDMAANVLGPSFFLVQELTWGEQRIQPKWSYHSTNYAALRPELLGRNNSERWLKDYNGQTYWYSINLHSFWPQSKIPKWLNVSLGYGVENMIGATDEKSKSLGYVPYRQYYFSLDVDFTKIQTKKKALRTIFLMLNSLKVPAPALEFNTRNGFVGHWLYF